MGYSINYKLILMQSPYSSKEDYNQDKIKLYQDTLKQFETEKELVTYTIPIFYYLVDEGRIVDNWDVEKDVLIISQEYPNIVFRIDILGADDNFENCRILFFNNGQYYEDKIKVIYPEFNINKLK